MPQRGDNPNEVLFETGSKWAYRNVDNYYDVDSSLQRPVDDILSSLEEEFDCPLVFLEFRRTYPASPHYIKPKTQRHDAQHQLGHFEELDRLGEFLFHEQEMPA